MSSPISLIGRYEWGKLTPSEREAVNDCVSVAGTRVAVGIGVVLTASAVIAQVRKGKRALPPGLRYGAGGFFTLVGGYVGFLSGGPWYTRRILAVPNSKFADDLRIVAGDWQTPVPTGPPLKTEEEAPSQSPADQKKV